MIIYEDTDRIARLVRFYLPPTRGSRHYLRMWRELWVDESTTPELDADLADDIECLSREAGCGSVGTMPMYREESGDASPPAYLLGGRQAKLESLEQAEYRALHPLTQDEGARAILKGLQRRSKEAAALRDIARRQAHAYF